MKLRALVIGAATLALGACATNDQMASEDRGDCFRAASVNSWGIVDNNHVRVTVGANRNYILTTAGNANSLDWSRVVALEGPSYICTGEPIGVAITGGQPVRSLIVTHVAREPDMNAVQGS